MGYYKKTKKRITKPCRICGSKKIVIGWFSKRGDSWLVHRLLKLKEYLDRLGQN